MSDNPNPYPIQNLATTNGILPGHGWPDDLLGDDDSFADFFGDFLFPFDHEDPLVNSILDQAKQQWQALFPEADERDRLMFIAGVLTVQMWWATMSIQTRNMHQPGEGDDPADLLFVTLDDADAFMAHLGVRLASTVHLFDDDEGDEDWSDLVERLSE